MAYRPHISDVLSDKIEPLDQLNIFRPSVSFAYCNTKICHFKSVSFRLAWCRRSRAVSATELSSMAELIMTRPTSAIRRLASAALHHINRGLRSMRASVEV